jgi:hypothetical protein
MAYLNSITKIIKQIQDSDEDTRDRYNYHRGLSLHMIKKLMGADHSQWGYIKNALKSGVNKGKLIKTGGKYRVVVTKKKSRKLRKCKYGRDRSTGKCRKRRSVKRKTSRKRRSVKRKTSRKRRSVKRKTSRKRRSVKRKTSRKRRSVKRKTSRKRRSVKRKTSRKRRSVKRKTSRKRRSVKRKGNKKLKFRMITGPEKKQIENEDLTCPICMNVFYKTHKVNGKEVKVYVKNEDIVGCMGAKDIPGWTCCSKTKKTGGCKNVYFHKKCLETWKESQKARHQEPSCPNCRAKQAPPPPSSRGKWKPIVPAALLAAVAALMYGNQSVPNLEQCHNPEIGSLGEGLPTCDGCNFVQPTSDGVLTWHWSDGAPDGVCPQHFADSYANWRANMDAESANMDAETWRKREGIEAKVI